MKGLRFSRNVGNLAQLNIAAFKLRPLKFGFYFIKISYGAEVHIVINSFMAEVAIIYKPVH